MASVTNLNDILQRKFQNFLTEEQSEIVEKGRFTDLTDLCQKDKGKYRNFGTSWYQRIPWLTGNTVNRKLYCWSCVLFPTGAGKMWNSTGFDDLKNLSHSVKKHEDSKEHVYSTIKLKLFKKNKRTDDKRQEVIENNVKVKRNREYLERLIDLATVMVQNGVPFRNNEKEGFYKHLLNVLKKYDDIVRTQMEENCLFKGLTKTVQIDLIRSIAYTVRQRIVDEVNAASFFSLQVDEVNCSTVSRQIAVSIRYVKDARAIERFIGLYDVGHDKKSDQVVQILKKELEPFNLKEKMISQSFDGGVVISTEIYDLQQSLKLLQVTQICQFVHCYAHEFNFLLAQSLRSIHECKVFFSIISSFTSFFNHHRLKGSVRNVSANCTGTVLSYIDIIKTNQQSILQILAYATTSEEFQNCADIICEASNLINHLKSLKFNVFIAIFHKIFTDIECTFETITKRPFDTILCRQEIAKLVSNLRKLKSDTAYQNIFNVVSSTGQTVMLANENMNELFLQILDHIVYELVGRFLDIELAEFYSLVSPQDLPTKPFSRKFPDTTCLQLVRESYKNYFDMVKLKNELDILYSDPSIAGIGEDRVTKASDMLWFMYENDIGTCLPTLYKFLELVVTIPSIAEPLMGRKCVLNRIKEYCVGIKNEEPRSELALLTIEKELLQEMVKSKEWYNEVINQFARFPSTSSIDLIYKNSEVETSTPVKEEIISEPELTIKSEPDLI